MRTILTFASLALCTGCLMFTFGNITEGRPRHLAKFPSDTAFYVSKTELRVKDRLEEELKARGFEVVSDEETCDYAIKVNVTNWEYNDAGFSGFRDRDDMTLSIRIVDRRKKVVESRATIEIRSDFKILKKYVETL